MCEYTRIFVFSITLASTGSNRQKFGPSATILGLMGLTVAEHALLTPVLSGTVGLDRLEASKYHRIEQRVPLK
jgi:hypothetical protein